MRLLLSLALVGSNAGCDLVFSVPFDEDNLVDASIDTPSCIGGTFSAPIEVPGTFQSGGLLDPSYASSNELWVVRQGTTLAMAVATRTEADGPFDTIVPSSLDTPQNDFDPNFSTDGREVVFGHENRLYTATRTSAVPGTPFGPPTEHPTILVASGLDLSADGRTLYFVDAQQLVAAKRASRAEPFEVVGDVLATGIEFPSVSADGLELFYHAADGIHRQTREMADRPFDATTDRLVVGDAADGDLTMDGTKLVFTRRGTIMESTRICR